jgi:hypothetical protein
MLWTEDPVRVLRQGPSGLEGERIYFASLMNQNRSNGDRTDVNGTELEPQGGFDRKAAPSVCWHVGRLGFNSYRQFLNPGASRRARYPFARLGKDFTGMGNPGPRLLPILSSAPGYPRALSGRAPYVDQPHHVEGVRARLMPRHEHRTAFPETTTTCPQHCAYGGGTTNEENLSIYLHFYYDS